MLVAILGFMPSSKSMARDLVAEENHPLAIDVAATTPETESDDSTILIGNRSADTLSASAPIAVENISKGINESTPSVATAPITQKNLTTIPIRNPYSQLVNLAFKGKGTDGVRNYADAAAQYCRTARDNNDANAQFALGWMYVNGRGVEKDEHIAALFFTKAAEQGHESAKNWLANSKGSVVQAALPSCMLPDLPTNLAHAHRSEENKSDNPEESKSEPETKPFYSKGSIYQLVSKIAPRYKIDTDLAMAFIAVESGFNPKATSPKNARGLMQLIPETAARFNVKNSYDPEDNIKGGLAYLQWLLTYFEGDVKLVAAAYNSGENAVEKYRGVPPYPETKKYVKKIAALYKKPFHPYRENASFSRRYSAKVSS
ncbi:MAG: transglycosylase SLT domain-containing protein [Methylophilaceae bacterium]